MRHQQLIAIMVLLILTVSCGEEMVSVDPVVRAEERFAADVAATSIKDGFLKHLDEDAVVFTPAPINGHKAYAGVEATDARLLWVPEVADIDSKGKFGWTSGPWPYFSNADAPAPIAAGHYTTVWRLKDGEWKALIDMGISHEPVPLEGVVAELWPGLRGEGGSGADKRELQESLGRAEHQLAVRAMEHGFRTALLEVADPAIRVLREASLPARGSEEAQLLLQDESGAATWVPAGIIVADSGELAFAFGTGNAEMGEDDREFSYTRIWRHSEAGWHVVSDIRAIIPARPEVQEDEEL